MPGVSSYLADESFGDGEPTLTPSYLTRSMLCLTSFSAFSSVVLNSVRK